MYYIISVILILLSLIILWLMYFSKKNNFIKLVPFLLFLLGVSINLLANIYSGVNKFIYSLFLSFSNTFSMYIGSFDLGTLKPLMDSSDLYLITVILAYIAFLSFPVMIVIRLYGKRFCNLFRAVKAKNKKVIVIFGDNELTYNFVNSLKYDTTRKIVMIIDEKNDNQFLKYYKTKCKPYIIYKNQLNYNRLLDDLFNKLVYIVSFLEREKNIKILHDLNKFEFLDKINDLTVKISFNDMLDIETMEDMNYLKGKVQFINIQKLISQHFCKQYPITKICNIDDIDKTKKCSYNFIGFGNTNQELFNNLIVNNSLRNAEIKYNLFDISNDALTSVNNEIINEYNKNIEVATYSLNVNELDFFNHIKQEIIEVYEQNIFIISLGDELKSLAIAKKISETFSANDCLDNYKCFVKSNEFNTNISKNQNKKLFIYGSLENILTEANIINDDYDKIAFSINSLYGKNSWNELSYLKQESNRSSAINIITKLNLLKLDITEDMTKSIDSKEYYQIYDKENNRAKYGGLNIISQAEFDNYLAKNVRNEIAYQEHLRWLAFHERHEVKKLDREIYLDMIKNEGERLRYHHLCMVSFEELIELSEFLNTKGFDIKDTDFLKYDYLLMDDLPMILENTGYYITKMER